MIHPQLAFIALATAGISLLSLMHVSHYSRKNAPIESKANQNLTGAVLEYARGLSVVKSFGCGGAAVAALENAIKVSEKAHTKVEWNFMPGSFFHLLALKCGCVGLGAAACFSAASETISLSTTLMLVFFSFVIFNSLEPIIDSAHVLGAFSSFFLIFGLLIPCLTRVCTFYMVSCKLAKVTSAKQTYLAGLRQIAQGPYRPQVFHHSTGYSTGLL